MSLSLSRIHGPPPRPPSPEVERELQRVVVRVRRLPGDRLRAGCWGCAAAAAGLRRRAPAAAATAAGSAAGTIFTDFTTGGRLGIWYATFTSSTTGVCLPSLAGERQPVLEEPGRRRLDLQELGGRHVLRPLRPPLAGRVADVAAAGGDRQARPLGQRPVQVDLAEPADLRRVEHLAGVSALGRETGAHGGDAAHVGQTQVDPPVLGRQQTTARPSARPWPARPSRPAAGFTW